MWILAVFTSLLFFSGFAAAQVVAPDCSLSWKWSFNSLGQNACTVAAYLMSTCNGGSFTIDSLQPGYSYTGPSGIDNSNLCKCSTIAYSLISACDACQSETWITWSEYSFNCTKTMPPSTFPNPVPSGTRVPQWALMDVTLENNWNSNKSLAVGDSPEVAPGTSIGASNSSGSASGSASGHPSTSAAGSSSTSSTSTSPSPTKSSSNVGAIVGGVVGGIAAIGIASLAAVCFLRRRRPTAPSTAYASTGALQPPMDEIHQPLADNATYGQPSLPGTPLTAMRLYDPNDPATFPSPSGASHMPQVPLQPPISPQPTVSTQAPTYNSEGGNPFVNMQTVLPQQGYHGLPTV
ncbi:hypothetical protein BC826DRAFT_1025820 [Russula brevipes]|nr:hypothetical protein BC826DRAFT_1025820 [Russula brevipes]